MKAKSLIVSVAGDAKVNASDDPLNAAMNQVPATNSRGIPC